MRISDPPTTEALFSPYLRGRLSGFADALTLDAPACNGPVIAGERLLEPATLAGLLDRHTAAEGYQNRRALASQWSKFFFSHLIIPTLAVQLGAGQPLDLAPHRWRASFLGDGLPEAFVFEASPFVRGDPADFSSLIDEALGPLVNLLRADCRLSTRVFWSNAAVYFFWTLGQLEGQAQVPPERLAAAWALLDEPRRADGRFNPFYRAFKHLPDGALDGNNDPAAHCRRLCCLRDMDPKWDLCANCPRAIHFTSRRDLAV